MITVKLIGGIGNQMFQYAAGRGLAIANNTRLALDITDLQTTLPRKNFTRRCFALDFFKIDARLTAFSKLGKRLPNAAFLINRLARFSRRTIKEKQPFIFDPTVASAGDGVYLDGWWQNEKYFSGIRETLLHDFSLKDEAGKEARTILGLIKNSGDLPAISLHIRRGDYVSNKLNNRYLGVCGPDYYRAALAVMGERIGNFNLFVFSDDIEWAKYNLSYAGKTVYVSGRGLGDGEELILMSKCSHNIIANSSFSWWGAWLNQNKNKIVVAPGKWFNIWNTSDLIPSGWIKV